MGELRTILTYIMAIAHQAMALQFPTNHLFLSLVTNSQ